MWDLFREYHAILFVEYLNSIDSAPNTGLYIYLSSFTLHSHYFREILLFFPYSDEEIEAWRSQNPKRITMNPDWTDSKALRKSSEIVVSSFTGNI